MKDHDAFELELEGISTGSRDVAELVEVAERLRAVAEDIPAPPGLRARRGAILAAGIPASGAAQRSPRRRLRGFALALAVVATGALGWTAALASVGWLDEYLPAIAPGLAPTPTASPSPSPTVVPIPTDSPSPTEDASPSESPDDDEPKGTDNSGPGGGDGRDDDDGPDETPEPGETPDEDNSGSGGGDGSGGDDSGSGSGDDPESDSSGPGSGSDGSSGDSE